MLFISLGVLRICLKVFILIDGLWVCDVVWGIIVYVNNKRNKRINEKLIWNCDMLMKMVWLMYGNW